MHMTLITGVDMHDFDINSKTLSLYVSPQSLQRMITVLFGASKFKPDDSTPVP